MNSQILKLLLILFGAISLVFFGIYFALLFFALPLVQRSLGRIEKLGFLLLFVVFALLCLLDLSLSALASQVQFRELRPWLYMSLCSLGLVCFFPRKGIAEMGA